MIGNNSMRNRHGGHGGASQLHTPSMLRDKRYVALGLAATVVFVYMTMRPIPSARNPGERRNIVIPSTPSVPSTSMDTNQVTVPQEESSSTPSHSELEVVTERYEPGPDRPLNPPHGGELKELLVSNDEAKKLTSEVAPNLKTWQLTERQSCDIELLMNGAFSPLDGFMDQDVYEKVVKDMRLGDKYKNAVWPMPITLDVSDEFASEVKPGDQIALRDQFYNLLAVMTISSKYTPNKEDEAKHVFKTTDRSHPAVDYLFNKAGNVYLGGALKGVQLPIHYDFAEYRRTPRQLREYVKQLGWSKFLAFQTRNPMHRAHIELTRIAAADYDVGVILHPSVGMTKPGDVPPHVRIRCYKAILDSHRYYKQNGADVSLLPLAMRMGGPREALWHVLIRKNYGATHFVVGRDHAGCKSAQGEDFYGSYDAQELVKSVIDEVGMTLVRVKKVVYVPSEDRYIPQDQLPEGAKTLSLSGTQFRKMMNDGEDIPPWFSDPEVIQILRTYNPPRPKRGFAVFFTGLSGGGKTTISHALISRLRALLPTRHLTILDGDVSRTHLSSELGFSVHDRNINVARMGYVASEAVRHRGMVVASTIAPFEKARRASRELVEATGGAFLLVHVSTSAEECANRDVKGLYAKAREGQVRLTGVSHPYEFPDQPDLTIDAGVVPVDTSVSMILAWLNKNGYLTEDTVGSDITSMDLESDGVLTTEKSDPAARHCVDKPSGSSGSGLPRLVFVVPSSSSSGTSIKDAFTKQHTDGGVVDVSMEVLEQIASRYVKQRLEEAAARAHKDAPDISDAVASATEDDTPEIAYTLWEKSRLASLTKGTDVKVTGDETSSSTDAIVAATKLDGAPKHVMVVLPSPGHKFVPSLLRIDPCAGVIFTGISKTDDTAGIVKGLQGMFPTRVAASDASGANIAFDSDQKNVASVTSIIGN